MKEWKNYASKVYQNIRRDNIKIKDIKVSERPRERLISNGVNSLSNEELLACILKDGTKGINVKEISNLILNSIDSIQELRYITYEDLTKINGIGSSKACTLLAAIELGNRVNAKVLTLNSVRFTDTDVVYEYFKNKIGYSKQEIFCCVYLDAKNMIIKEKELFRGTLNYSMVHPREVFKEAYILGAVSIICIHNHPSGKVEPSKDDINLTKRLISVGDLRGIKVIHHLIIGSNSYYSFLKNGDI